MPLGTEPLGLPGMVVKVVAPPGATGVPVAGPVGTPVEALSPGQMTVVTGTTVWVVTVDEAGQLVTVGAQWVTVMREVVKTVVVVRVTEPEPVVAGAVVAEPAGVVLSEPVGSVDGAADPLEDGVEVPVETDEAVPVEMTPVEDAVVAVVVMVTGESWLHWASPRMERQRSTGISTRPPEPGVF